MSKQLPDLPKETSQQEKDFLSLAYLDHRRFQQRLKLDCFIALTRNNFPASPDMKFFLKNAQALYDWAVKADTAQAPAQPSDEADE